MQIKMKELPASERPYEKMELYGAKTLSNAELLAIIIKCGTKEETAISLAQKILNLNKENNNKQTKDLKFLQDITIEELQQIKGIGKVKAIQIKAACELAKRMSKPIDSVKIQIKSTKDVANLFIDELRYEKQEIAKLLILNSKNVILKIIDIAIGGENFSTIQPSMILKEPIKMGAHKIILVHNHPCGNPQPSDNDYRITERIYESADVMGIELLDHVIIGENSCQSVLVKNQNKKYR